jgi:site-specific DNA-methyltransferase (adenine-specific)
MIAADPPWRFGDKLPGPGRGAEKHYETMSVEEIRNFDLPPIAPDALLLLWRVSSMVEEAYEVVRAWGFEPKSEIVWRKLTKTGKEHFGMGRYVRASHETCIVARRGRPQILDRSVRSVFSAPVGRHSAKPPEFFAIAERLAVGPRVELFSREARPGWTVLGLEAPANVREILGGGA